MNMVKHFETYRTSLGKDALDGCAEYAKTIPTAKPEIYPTAFDYLNLALKGAREAIGKEDKLGYKSWVNNHQRAMTALLEKMSAEKIPAGKEITALLDFIHDKGWKWYKFCSKVIIMDITMPLPDSEPRTVPVVWIPRYTEQYAPYWKSEDAAVFDADEMGFFLTKGRRAPSEMQVVVDFKLKNPGTKFLKADADERTGFFKPIARVNSDDTVTDWSLPLF